jgi:competence protein ComFB
MEEIVRSTIEDLARDERAADTPRYCIQEECLIDAICYVLNRVAPRYVSSARGYAHILEDLTTDPQIAVDLVKLSHEAMQRVSSVRRSYYDDKRDDVERGPVFNFPTITGRILDGTSFSPIGGIEVELVIDESHAEMFDARWTNPYVIDEHTKGTYLFWPKPRRCETAETARPFSCELRASGGRYEPLTHYFSIELTSGEYADEQIGLSREHRIPDLYLFTP